MIDSIEKLAQSRTFIVRNGKVSVDDSEEHAAGVDTFQPQKIVDKKYQIIALIGTGGMGAVYKVHHLLLKKDMALKTFLSRRLSAGSLERFRREAQAIAKLQHKNIVHVYDFGEAEGNLPYYTMELLSGHSLADELKQSGKMDPIDALQTFKQVAEALAHAHRHNIVHRDIKPANIILVSDSLTPTGSPPVKLVDFGIAKLAENSSYSNDQSLTQAGTIFGSPLYMSPEQSLGLPTDFRTDMYSFGCALYESLTGHPPFIGNSALQTMAMHQHDTPPALQQSLVGFAIPQRLEALLEKLLAKTAENRYRKFDQIVDEIGLCSLALASGGSTPSDYRPDLNSSRQFKFEAPERPGENTVEKLQRLPIKKLVVACAAIVALGAGVFVSFVRPNNSAQKPSSQPQSDKPFFVGIRHDSDGDKRVFNFGDLKDFGYFSAMDGKRRLHFDCEGEVAVRATQAIHFYPDVYCSAHPELLRRFGPDDLYEVQILQMPGFVNTNIPQLVEEISHLSGLRALDLATVAITPTALTYIGKLNNLKVLDVRDCSDIQGKDLAALTNLPNLEFLSVSEISHLSPLWSALASDRAHVKILIANRCQFSDQDFVNIAQLSELTYFSLTNSQMSAEQLTFLTPAKNLQQLNLTHDFICPKHIPILARFTRLRKITLPKITFSSADLQKLKDALPPHCMIENDSTETKIEVPQDF